ncbi:MAG: cbb3-type cytochrome oxidase assembly protein CcoS [Gammaproteobacteria bacterium]|nr:cbb3-type cytochrome oxidase assembly protein CcoS [Gammaproteobacteria bacterium]
MEVIYLLIPISLILVGVIIYFLFWAIRSGQFDDMEGSGFQILMDDDKAKVVEEADESTK